MSGSTTMLALQPMSMSPAAHLAAVSDLARYCGHAHELYASPPALVRVV